MLKECSKWYGRCTRFPSNFGILYIFLGTFHLIRNPTSFFNTRSECFTLPTYILNTCIHTYSNSKTNRLILFFGFLLLPPPMLLVPMLELSIYFTNYSDTYSFFFVSFQQHLLMSKKIMSLFVLFALVVVVVVWFGFQ